MDDDPWNVAMTPNELYCHTDAPFLIEPAYGMLFHCIHNKVFNSGNNIYVDGFNVANTMKEEYKYYYNVLTKYKVLYTGKFTGVDDANWDLYDYKYIINVNRNNTDYINSINFNDYERIVTNQGKGLSNSLIQNYKINKDISKAIKIFQSLCQDKSNQINFWMNPGELTLLNNHRLLHGRDIGNTQRKFKGAYILKQNWYTKKYNHLKNYNNNNSGN